MSSQSIPLSSRSTGERTGVATFGGEAGCEEEGDSDLETVSLDGVAVAVMKY